MNLVQNRTEVSGGYGWCTHRQDSGRLPSILSCVCASPWLLCCLALSWGYISLLLMRQMTSYTHLDKMLQRSLSPLAEHLHAQCVDCRYILSQHLLHYCSVSMAWHMLETAADRVNSATPKWGLRHLPCRHCCLVIPGRRHVTLRHMLP